MEGNGNSLTKKNLVMRGTLVAAIITVPSLIVFFALWVVLDDLVQAAIIGGVAHFVAMGLSLRISRRFLVGGAGANPDV